MEGANELVSCARYLALAELGQLLYTRTMTAQDVKQVAVRMSAEDMRFLEELQTSLGVRSQSEVIRMSLRALAKERGVTITTKRRK